jgi:hypothetical protein
MNNKSIRDYINLIENAQQGVEEGSYYTKGGTGQKSKWTVTLKNGKKKTINAATREGIKDFLTPEELIIGIKSAVKQQGVAEGEFTTYLVSVMDASTKEHWRIEVKVTSPEAAKERAEAMGYKVLDVKEKPGVEEGAPELLKAEMPLVRHIERELAQHGVQKDDPEYKEKFKHALAYYRKFGNIDQINKHGVEEEQLEETTPEAIEKVEQLYRK